MKNTQSKIKSFKKLFGMVWAMLMSMSLFLAFSCTVFGAVNPTSVSLNTNSVTLNVGESVSLTTSIKPSNATNKTVSWSSGNKSVATVSAAGKVTAKGSGTTTITATTVNGKTASCRVKVRKRIAVININYDADTQALVRGINSAGAQAVFVTSTADACKCDGLAIPGGYSVNPGLYGGNPAKAGGVNVVRDELQWAAISQFEKMRKPILGVCRGSQLLNVYFGGTLNQSIKGHANGVYKVINIDRSSLFYQDYGSSENVIHYHVQGCKKMGSNLRITMKCTENGDTVIEGFEHNYLPIYGVQWHPELMGSSGLKVLSRFISIC